MYPEHLKTFDYIGPHRYFLTFCTYQRNRCFASRRQVDLVHAQMLRAAREHDFAVTAYCYMPDHLHLLVEGYSEASDCRQFIRLAKQLSGYYFQLQFACRLWQRYGFERTLRDEQSSLSVARYIIENPLRAGLVTRVDDYPFAGSDLYTVDSIVDAVQLDRGWARSG